MASAPPLPLPTEPSRWFQPRRDDLARARAAIRTPADFAAFVGGWADDRRRFMVFGDVVDCRRCDGTGQGMNFDPVDCVVCNAQGRRRALTLETQPRTLDDCLAVAADLSGIAKAEEHAREAMKRLGSWRVPQWERRIVWVSLPEPPGGVPRDDVPGTTSPYVTLFGEFMLAQSGFSAWSSDGTERFDANASMAARTSPAIEAASGPLSGVREALATIQSTAAFAKNVKRPGRKRLPHEPDPATLEDPFEPLGALLDTGYVFGGWSDVHIEMWMPSLALVS